MLSTRTEKKMRKVFIISVLLLMCIAPSVEAGRVHKVMRYVVTDSIPELDGTTFTINMNEGGFQGSRLCIYVDKDTLSGGGTLSFTAKGFFSPGFMAVNDGFDLSGFDESGTAGMSINGAAACGHFFQVFTGSSTSKLPSLKCNASIVQFIVNVTGFSDGAVKISYIIFED